MINRKSNKFPLVISSPRFTVGFVNLTTRISGRGALPTREEIVPYGRRDLPGLRPGNLENRRK